MFRTSRKVTLGDTGDGSTGFMVRGAYDTNSPVATASTKTGMTFSRSTLSEMSVPNKVVPATNKADVETASVSGLPAATQINEVIAVQLMTDVLEAFVDQTTRNGVNTAINKMYADMYYHDSICGSAVDLMSVMPFSDFSLTGVKDARMLQRFQEALENMNVSTLLPSISVDYLVLGSFLGSMSWDEDKKTFNGITPHNIDFAEIFPVPIHGEDPLINISLPLEIIKTMAMQDPRLEAIKARIPDDVRKALNGGGGNGRNGAAQIALDPNSTIFIPRRALMRDYAGVSLFKRALPAWFVEKALIRGTIDQAYKRQRAALHITVGDGQNWTPTKEQMAEIANLFLNIDLDPVGALVVTRSDVNVNEVRRGDDYYKWSDAFDSLSTIKLRAIGVNETFITGDANYATMDKTLSVMLENIRNYRSLITQEVFYKKTFPAIAQENGVVRRRYSVETAGEVDPRWHIAEDGTFIAEISSAPNLSDYDKSKYVIPRVQWHKQLLPEADDAYMGLLTTLEEKGVPIPLRILAAAGGLKMDTLFEEMAADIRDRERLKKYKDAISKFATKSDEGGDEMGGEEASATLTELATALLQKGGSLKRRGLLTRGPAHENIVSPSNTRNGKLVPTTAKGRKVLSERLHKVAASVAAENARRENARSRKEYTPEKTYSFSKRKNDDGSTEE